MLFFANTIYAVLFSVLVVTRLARAIPISAAGANELIVYNPVITSPKASAAWPKGSLQVVKWDTTGIPPQYANNSGVLLLGYLEQDSENLDIDHPLASGFLIGSGSVQVSLPSDIPARDNYIVVLLGDSGNRSPKFKIH